MKTSNENKTNEEKPESFLHKLKEGFETLDSFFNALESALDTFNKFFEFIYKYKKTFILIGILTTSFIIIGINIIYTNIIFINTNKNIYTKDKIDKKISIFDKRIKKLEAIAHTHSKNPEKPSESDNKPAQKTGLSPSLDRSIQPIIYLKKDIDSNIVLQTLNELGYETQNKISEHPENPTTTIWFGKNVNIDNVKEIAIALIHAGVKIKAIKPFWNDNKVNLIEIGGNKTCKNVSPLTIENIQSREKNDFKKASKENDCR